MPYKDPNKWREWNRQRLKANMMVLDKMKSGPCHDCGGIFPPCVMEFDHVPERGPKRKNVCELVGSRKITAPTVVEEMAKCDLVCANCHRIRTHERQKRSAA